jgi:hypothetical protein
MRNFIDKKPGIGYVVTELELDRYAKPHPIRNFGDRQSDAIEFRNDCERGVISEQRINLFIRTYTNTPYQYLGNGNLKKQK